MSFHRFSSNERIAAYLADPRRMPQGPLPWSDCEAESVVHTLRKNKVPLLGINGSAEGAQLLRDPVFQAARQQEAQQLAGLRAEYSIVKERLAGQGIPDVMIKSVGLAPSFPYRSDNLDVLYRPEHEPQVRQTLRDLGYVELTNVEEPHKYLFRKFHMGHSVSAIHLHVHVGWMVSFLDEQTLWQRCAMSDDDRCVMVPGSDDAMLTTLAHYFYEDKRVALLDVIKFAHCLRRGVNWDEVYRVADWRGWRDGLNVSLLLCAYQERALYGETLAPPALLQRGWQECPSWTRTWMARWLDEKAILALWEKGQKGDAAGIEQLPLRIPFVFSKVFFYTKLLRDPTRSSHRKVKDLAVHTANGSKLRLRIHSQPAALVTFSGVDGSGKTTQARALQSAFHTCHLRAKHVWTRGGSSRWIGLFTRRGKRGTAETPVQGSTPRQSSDVIPTRQQRFGSRWLRWGWSWLTTIELLLQYARHVTLPLILGRVVICDRYIYDAFADWAAYFGQETVERRLAARVLRWLTPRPHISYWLDTPAGIAQSRSAEPLPIDFLDAQSAAYRRMAPLFGMQRVDGSQSEHEIADAIVYQVLSGYFSDYHTLVNTLFLKNPGQWR
jgi:thymidylate kinase